MSAIEQLSSISSERRRFPRFRPASAIPVQFGRGGGILADISLRGARVRHDIPVALHTTVRLTFEWQGERFCAPGEVLASRMIGLGEAARFESRVEFHALGPGTERLLARVIETLQDGDLRRWVANLQGWESGAASASATPGITSAFVRYRLVRGRWERKWTKDSGQPGDGFTLPASIDDVEARQLCETFADAGEDSRHLVRLIAAAVVDQAITPD